LKISQVSIKKASAQLKLVQLSEKKEKTSWKLYSKFKDEFIKKVFGKFSV
jgi:hypothetical protein